MFRLFRNTPKKAPAAPSEGRAAIRLKVMRPERFADAPLVADELILGRTVVLNLEGMESRACRHLLDFISGVTYALDGSIKKISGDATFLVTPNSIALSDAEEAEEALRTAGEGAPPADAAPRATETAERAPDPVAAMFSDGAGADEE